MIDRINLIEEVTSYRISSGELYVDINRAKFEQKNLDDLENADAIISSGGSVADCLRLFGFNNVDEIFEQVTKETQLSIGHWQCRDTPGYRILYFINKGTMRVGGNVGAWSGGYSSNVRLEDLARYAKHPKTII